MNTDVWAGGTDTSGAQLKQVVEEYFLSASPTDGKAQQLKATMGKADWSSYDSTTMLCLVGYGVVVGKLVWDTRMVRDHCDYSSTRDSFNSSTDYTVYCDHYKWEPGCLMDAGCPN